MRCLAERAIKIATFLNSSQFMSIPSFSPTQGVQVFQACFQRLEFISFVQVLVHQNLFNECVCVLQLTTLPKWRLYRV